MSDIRRTVVFREPGRFAGWPANYGLWAWGQEIVAVFALGWVGPSPGIHPRDTSRPFVPVVARSLDGGQTWQHEEFTGRIPGSSSLSADEHGDDPLKAAPRLAEADFTPVPTPVEFDDPEVVVLCGRTGLEAGAVSWFYVSRDRARTWSGPHRFPDFGLPGVSARTDVVPLGGPRALALLTGAKSDGREGRVFAARTEDGGTTWERVGFVGPQPPGWAIMPASLRAADGAVLTAVRCAGPSRQGEEAAHWVDLYRSTDEGVTWEYVTRPVATTGSAGNPPALVRDASGLLVIAYGYRDEPRGLRSVTSTDEGRTWSEPVVLTDDVPARDLGYPRAVALDGGGALAVYYRHDDPLGERWVEAVRWDPTAS